MAVLSGRSLRSTRVSVPRTVRRALCLLLLLASGVFSQAQTREYQLKAAFLFQFTKFVEWPQGTFADTNAPLIMGILGENPFEGALQSLVSGERVNGRPIELRQLQREDPLDACHVLFISKSEAGRLPAILASVRGKPLLTVSDMEGFAQRGGMAELFVDQNRIRFRVNNNSASTSGLTISSKLLRLAEIVRNER